jgi:hypothetical protein
MRFGYGDPRRAARSLSVLASRVPRHTGACSTDQRRILCHSWTALHTG